MPVLQYSVPGVCKYGCNDVTKHMNDGNTFIDY